MSKPGDEPVSDRDRNRSSVGTKTLIKSLNDQAIDQMAAMRNDLTGIRSEIGEVEKRVEKRVEDRFEQHDRLMSERQQRFDERDEAHDNQIGELRGTIASQGNIISGLKSKIAELDKNLAVAIAKGLGAGSLGGGGLGALVAYFMSG